MASYESFQDDLRVYFEASCEYVYNSMYLASNVNPLLALSLCLKALAMNGFSSSDKSSVLSELQKIDILSPSSQHLREYSINVDYQFPTSTHGTSASGVSDLISLRRGSVSAECVSSPDSISKCEIGELSKDKYPKSKTTVLLIRQAISSNILFRELDNGQLTDIISCMFQRHTSNNEVIITQGDSGDYFYVIEEGEFDVFVNNEKCSTLGKGASFGELALLYNSPRTATVVSTKDFGLLWAIDRQTFRKIVINYNYQKRKRYELFLKNIPIFSTLSQLELSKLSDCLKPQVFKENDIVIRQGDSGDSFYIITEGAADVYVNDVFVKSLSVGDYFGEMALITRKPRRATVAVRDRQLLLLRLDTDAFDRLLGPLIEIMKRNMELYTQYTPSEF